MRTENRKMREKRNYVLTVEGETEQWYFQWLKEQINKNDTRLFDVSMTISVQQKPSSYWKNVNKKSTPEIFHICDVESNSKGDTKKFESVLKEMKEAKKQKGIKYTLGYSNFTFELWMILHKMEDNHHYNDKRKYLGSINRCFQEKFESLSQYKQESEFHRCLSKLSLEDVFAAVERAEKIRKNNEENSKVLKCSGYSYYCDNPSLTIDEVVKRILVECGVSVS